MIRRTFPVPVESDHHLQHRAPLIALDELGDLVDEPRVQRLELRLSFLLVLPDLVAGHRSTARFVVVAISPIPLGSW